MSKCSKTTVSRQARKVSSASYKAYYGITLIETLMSVGLLGVVLLPLLMTSTAYLSTKLLNNRTKSELSQNVNALGTKLNTLAASTTGVDSLTSSATNLEMRVKTSTGARRIFRYSLIGAPGAQRLREFQGNTGNVTSTAAMRSLNEDSTTLVGNTGFVYCNDTTCTTPANSLAVNQTIARTAEMVVFDGNTATNVVRVGSGVVTGAEPVALLFNAGDNSRKRGVLPSNILPLGTDPFLAQGGGGTIYPNPVKVNNTDPDGLLNVFDKSNLFGVPAGGGPVDADLTTATGAGSSFTALPLTSANPADPVAPAITTRVRNSRVYKEGPGTDTSGNTRTILGNFRIARTVRDSFQGNMCFSGNRQIDNAFQVYFWNRTMNIAALTSVQNPLNPFDATPECTGSLATRRPDVNDRYFMEIRDNWTYTPDTMTETNVPLGLTPYIGEAEPIGWWRDASMRSFIPSWNGTLDNSWNGWRAAKQNMITRTLHPYDFPIQDVKESALNGGTYLTATAEPSAGTKRIYYGNYALGRQGSFFGIIGEWYSFIWFEPTAMGDITRPLFAGSALPPRTFTEQQMQSEEATWSGYSVLMRDRTQIGDQLIPRTSPKRFWDRRHNSFDSLANNGACRGVGKDNHDAGLESRCSEMFTPLLGQVNYYNPAGWVDGGMWRYNNYINPQQCRVYPAGYTTIAGDTSYNIGGGWSFPEAYSFTASGYYVGTANAVLPATEPALGNVLDVTITSTNRNDLYTNPSNKPLSGLNFDVSYRCTPINPAVPCVSRNYSNRGESGTESNIYFSGMVFDDATHSFTGTGHIVTWDKPQLHRQTGWTSDCATGLVTDPNLVSPLALNTFTTIDKNALPLNVTDESNDLIYSDGAGTLFAYNPITGVRVRGPQVDPSIGRDFLQGGFSGGNIASIDGIAPYTHVDPTHTVQNFVGGNRDVIALSTSNKVAVTGHTSTFGNVYAWYYDNAVQPLPTTKKGGVAFNAASVNAPNVNYIARANTFNTYQSDFTLVATEGTSLYSLNAVTGTLTRYAGVFGSNQYACQNEVQLTGGIITQGAMTTSPFDNGLYLLNTNSKVVNFYSDRFSGTGLTTSLVNTPVSNPVVGPSEKTDKAQKLAAYLRANDPDLIASVHAQVLIDHFIEFELIRGAWAGADGNSQFYELVDCLTLCTTPEVRVSAKYFIDNKQRVFEAMEVMPSTTGRGGDEDWFDLGQLTLYANRSIGFPFTDLLKGQALYRTAYGRNAAQYFVQNKAGSFTPMETWGGSTADDIFSVQELDLYAAANVAPNPNITTFNRSTSTVVGSIGVTSSFTTPQATTPTGIAVSRATGLIYVLDADIKSVTVGATTTRTLNVHVYRPNGTYVEPLSLNVSDGEFKDANDRLVPFTGQAMRLTLDEKASQFFVHVEAAGTVGNPGRVYQFAVAKAI